MWGSWFTLIAGVLGGILLLGALVLSPWAPLFAIAFVLVALAVVSFFMSGRRQRSEPDTPEQAKARSEAILARGADAETAGTRPTRTGGAPASGEGS